MLRRNATHSWTGCSDHTLNTGWSWWALKTEGKKPNSVELDELSRKPFDCQLDHKKHFFIV